MSEFNPKEQIRKLRKKSESLRNAHGILYKKYSRASKVLHSLILISSSIVAILTFSDFNDFLVLFHNLEKNVYNLSVGLIASAVFILTVLEEFLTLNKRAASHESAVKQLTTFIRLADSIEKNEEVNGEDVDRITNQYTMINENMPLIPDSIFLKSKQKLQRKVYISKTLDNEPFVPLFIINGIYVLKSLKKYLFKK